MTTIRIQMFPILLFLACMVLMGLALLIVALVFLILYRQSKKRPAGPRKWQKLVSIICAGWGVQYFLPFGVLLIWALAR